MNKCLLETLRAVDTVLCMMTVTLLPLAMVYVVLFLVIKLWRQS